MRQRGESAEEDLGTRVSGRGLFGLVFALLASGGAAFSRPQTPEDITALVGQDASAGYEAALTLFADAKVRGDVDAMMDVLRVLMSLFAEPNEEGSR